MKLDPLAILGANIREQTENYLDELPPLMMWGDFIFQLNTMAFSKLSVQESWNWASQGRFGRRDKLQYTGKKAPTIKFDSEIYAAFVNESLLTLGLKKYGLINSISADPVEHLRIQADSKTPYMLVTGAGKVMGFWVITEMSQDIDEFKPNSQPKHQSVSITMQFYGLLLNDDQALPSTLSLGFTNKNTKIKDALDKMKTFLRDNLNV